MALLLGVSWLSILLWGCICFPAQKGYIIAHGYDLYEKPQAYGHYYSGVPLKTNYEDETQPLRHQNFASLQKQSRKDVSPATKLREEVVQSQPVRVADEHSVASSTPSVQKKEHSSSDHPHPFSLLMKKHTQDPAKGVSFPTINHLERFIESMKSSFLTPGRDTRRYFQTARETMKNVGETSEAYGSDSGKEDTAELDNNEVWSIPGAKYQMPDKRVSSNVPDGGLPGGNNELFRSAAEDERAASTSYKKRKQKLFPTRSFYGKDSAFPVNTPNSPSQDFSYYPRQISKIKPLTSEQNIPEPRYTSHSRDSLIGYQTPSGFHRVTQADLFHPKKPPNLNSYNKGYYTPRGQHYSPDLLPKHRDINHVPTVYQPASSNSLFSSYNNLFPQRRSGHVGIQTNSPHEPYNQVDRSHLAFPMKPSRSPHGSRGHNSYVGYQKVSNAPSSLTAQARHRQKSDLYNQNLVPVIHRPVDRKSHGIDSVQSGAATHRVRNPLGSFSLPHRRGLSPNDGYVAAMRAGLLQSFSQPASMQMLQSTVNKPSRNLAYWPSQQLSASIGSPSNCVNWRNPKNVPSRRTQKGLQSYVNAYLKSKNRFARATSYVTNGCYTPYQEVTSMTAKPYWNMS